MATSLTSTGVVFPDATVQTTAATSAGGTFEAVASGSLSDGSTVVINTDGTVSVVALGGPEAGVATVFESARSDEIAAAYGSGDNKVVIIYSDVGNSYYATAVVGEVSGATISFGTPVVFYSDIASTSRSIAYNPTNNNYGIFYRIDSPSWSYGQIGTVSGTSISFGSATIFDTDSASQLSATYDSSSNKFIIFYSNSADGSFYGKARVCTESGGALSYGTVARVTESTILSNRVIYDTTNNKLVFAYYDLSNASYGTAKVGTVSGTNISFGTAVVFESASTSSISLAYDSVNSKIIFSYRDSGNSGYGTAIVGTVSGTNISFGTAVVFESASTTPISTTYDSANNKIVAFYRDLGNSNYGTAVVGTVSGTSISFDIPTVFLMASLNDVSSTYDSTAQKIVVAYKDGGNSNYGTATVFSAVSTNLTSENFIGISDGAYTDTQTATVLIAGSVSEAQSGLTAGQVYYVQGDGTLSTTPDDPSVYAGTAIAATKLIVQG